MAFRAVCAGLLLFSGLTAGCGTVTNLVLPGPEEGGKTPFGGVRQDKQCMEKAASGELAFTKHPAPKPPMQEQQPQVVLALLCAADIPLSLVGDVLTLPYTLGYTWINQPVPYPPVIVPNPPVTLNPPMTLPAPPTTLPDPIETLPNPRPAPDLILPPAQPGRS